MVYQTVSFRDFRGRSPIASFFKCDFSYGYAAVDKISTDTERRAVPLRQLKAKFHYAIMVADLLAS